MSDIRSLGLKEGANFCGIFENNYTDQIKLSKTRSLLAGELQLLFRICRSLTTTSTFLFISEHYCKQ